jgi:transglutaminase/protease-like cytokinesis protein 3
VIIDGTLSQNKINERYFLMHPEFFIFDRMTKKERELYKEASLVKTNNKIIVQKFRVQFTY